MIIKQWLNLVRGACQECTLFYVVIIYMYIKPSEWNSVRSTFTPLWRQFHLHQAVSMYPKGTSVKFARNGKSLNHVILNTH